MIKLGWATRDRNATGNALGYSLHDRMMRKYSETYFDFDEEADIVLHIVSADQFRPIPGRINVLFTMWEFMDVPKSYQDAVSMADVLIVPCKFCKDIFRPYTEAPIYVCQEGIEPENFPFFDRYTLPNNKFRFLWNGAPNMRKGYPYILKALEVIGKMPNVEMYIKTTIPKVDPKDIIKQAEALCDKEVDEAKQRILKRIENGMQMETITRLGEHNNIIFDTRKVDLEELKNLYNSAHCFLFPTLGEGWGLTLTEAMATGAPCIATNVTGVREYFNDSVGIELKYTIQELDMREQYGLMTRSFMPDVNDFMSKMLAVTQQYDIAYAMGKKASERIHAKFTWKRSALRLFDIIQDVQQKNLTNDAPKVVLGRF